MKIEIEVPNGKYCTGCPCSLILPIYDGSWHYGCSLLHDKCRSDGDYGVRALKNRRCPSVVAKQG